MKRKRDCIVGGVDVRGPCAAQPQVVADSACDKYAVDIAAFATCENGRVVRAESVRLQFRRTSMGAAAGR